MRYWILSSFVLLTLTLSASTAFGQPWDFEGDTLDGWVSDASNLAITDTMAFSGNQSVKVWPSDTSEAKMYFKQNNLEGVGAGDTLYASFWIAGEDTSAIPAVQIYTMDNGWGWTTMQYVETDSLGNGPNTWNTYALKIPEDASTPLNEIGFELMRPSTDSLGAIFVDMITTENPVMQPWGFEDGTSQAWASAAGSSAIIDSMSYEGDNSLMFTGTDTAANFTLKHNFAKNITSGDTLVYKVWMDEASLEELSAIQPYLMHGSGWNWHSGWMEELTAGEWNTVRLGTPEEMSEPLQEIGLQFMGASEGGTPTVYVDGVMVQKDSTTTDIAEMENDTRPAEFELGDNYPNPFNPSTVIPYEVSTASKVTIEVYNVTGRKITNLVNRQHSPGSYTVQFKADNLGSGIYFYKLKSGSYSKVKRMMLIK